jgi:hypothetical protein
MMPSRQRRLFRQSGYVAVYVIAIVLLMTGVVLEGVRTTREKSALARQSFERIAAATRIQAAQQLLKARLEAHWSLNFLERASLHDLAARQQAVMPIDNAEIKVTAEDAELRPDANLLNAEEWQRLLVAYGLQGTEATELAQRILLLKQSLTGGKFVRLADLIDYPFLPSTVVDGKENLPPWRDLLAIGHGSKRLHVRDTPLPLFQAILTAGPEQIERWKDIRASRTPTVADAELVFGAEARNYCYEGEMQQLRLHLTAGIAGTERDILIRVGKDNRLVIERL